LLLPGSDLDVLNAYVQVVDVGAGCSPSKHSVKAVFKEVKDYMCMVCDPDEPTYRFQTRFGDVKVGGVNAPDPSMPVDDFTWRICRSWLYGKDGVSGFWGNGSKYDRCGIQFLNDCSAIKQWSFDSATGQWVESDVPILYNWDPGMCAGDPIIPKLEFGSDPEPAASLMQIIPNFIPNFKFVITDDLDPSFRYNNTPCFRGGAAPISYLVGSVLLLVFVSFFFLP
jgi:hypothetical protein